MRHDASIWMSTALKVAALALVAIGAACGDDAPKSTGPVAGPSAPVDTSAGAVPPAAYQPDDSWRALVSTPNRDLALLELMVRLRAVHEGMAPFIRHRPSFEQLALAADAIVAMANEPSFVNYTAATTFERDPARFEVLRKQLLEGARSAAEAARADDIEVLWSSYQSMDATCTGCHKRYGPLY